METEELRFEDLVVAASVMHSLANTSAEYNDTRRAHIYNGVAADLNRIMIEALAKDNE